MKQDDDGLSQYVTQIKKATVHACKHGKQCAY